MEKRKDNILSFSFTFKSEDSDLDFDWNGYTWESFHDVASVPMLGDIIDFGYIFDMDYLWPKQIDRIEGFENLLNDYKAVRFKVIERTYCPFTNSHKGKSIGTWCLYYLMISPILGEDLTRHYEIINRQRERLEEELKK